MKRVLILGGVVAGAASLMGSLARAQRPEIPLVPPGAVELLALPATISRQVPPGTEKPTGPVDRAECVTCHTEVLQHQTLHGPVGVNACEACHTVVSEAEHTFKLAREGAEMCTFCHDVDLGADVVVHEPLRTGDCLACHDPHGGSDRMMLGQATAGTLCQNCHDDLLEGKSSQHGPVAAGACIACHSAHSSPYPGLLQAEGPAVCTGCHAATKMQMESMRVVHDPVREDCQSCHDPHASNHPMMLKMEPQQLCLGCHEAIEHMVESANTKHAAVTTERACLNCHDPHASDHPRMLQTDMMTLCFECHNKEIEQADGTKLMNMKSLIETGTSLHGPISQHNCAACHQIHGGDNFRLLVKEYPPEFYAPFKEESYALCFSCHDLQLVHDERTTALTNFRNGDLNLHYVHVNREKKGRTCRACHETHASSKAKHIRESVPFGPGGWMLPIRFEKMETGGSCAPGCHVAYRYDRDNPVEYLQPTDAIWPTKSGAPEGGPGGTP